MESMGIEIKDLIMYGIMAVFGIFQWSIKKSMNKTDKSSEDIIEIKTTLKQHHEEINGLKQLMPKLQKTQIDTNSLKITTDGLKEHVVEIKEDVRKIREHLIEGNAPKNN
jgi:uncharacterized coiled-coil DUF342 family protein